LYTAIRSGRIFEKTTTRKCKINRAGKLDARVGENAQAPGILRSPDPRLAGLQNLTGGV